MRGGMRGWRLPSEVSLVLLWIGRNWRPSRSTKLITTVYLGGMPEG